MKWVIYGGFIISYLLVTYFGIGPVLLADGSLLERLLTLAVVILIYIVLTFLLVWWRKMRKK